MTLLDVALSAHDAGLCVVPPKQDGSKGPLGTWKRYQADRPTRTQVERWYDEPDRTGIGFVGGAVSGGLELFEFEGRAVEAGLVVRFIEDAKADPALTEIIDRISKGWAETSPSGGLHLHYRCTETGCVKLAKRADGRDLIETKGEGGYMIVAPSNGTVHPQGGAWEAFAGSPVTVATITAEERTLLFDHARRYHEQPAARPGHTEPTGDWQEVRPPRTGDSWMDAVIDDHNARTSWVDVLAGTFEHHHDQGNVAYWHFIGAENQVGATTNAKGTDTLIVFSGTAAGAGWDTYDGNGKAPSYDRFSAHVLITRGRNDTNTRTEVARALRHDGYGPASSTRSPPPNVDAETGEKTGGTSMPSNVDDFFDARFSLDRLRTFARSRRAAPWAATGAALVRCICAVEPFVMLPPTIGGHASLNLFLGLVGPSGSGKGAAEATGADAINFGDLTSWGIGSGEGIPHLYLRRTKAKDGEPAGIEQHTTRLLLRAAEVDTLDALKNRSGSTLLPKIRDAWIGDDLSFGYVDETKRLPLRAHSYRLGLIVGIQPERAGVLLDHADDGTPQRFAWMPSRDPDVPIVAPDEPEPLPAWKCPTWPAATSGRSVLTVCSEATHAMDQAAVARHRGEVGALDGHALLARLKIAAALGILDGRPEVNAEDWQLAGVFMEVSDHTRTATAEALAYKSTIANWARGQAEGEREIVRTTTVDEASAVRVARKLQAKLTGDWTIKSKLRGTLNSRDRDHFDDSIERLIAAGAVEVEEYEYHGAPGLRYRLIGGVK